MRRLFLAALLGLLGLSACSFDRPLGFRAVNACAENDECSTERCYEGVCAAPPEEPLRVSLQVLTGPGDLERAPASSVIPTLEVRDNARVDLTVSALARVAGTVRFRGEPVPALLSFARPPAAPGAPTSRVEVETGDPFGDGAVDYVASLAAGEEYTLEVRVSGVLFDSTGAAPELDAMVLASRQLPPLVFEGLRFAPGTHTFDVEFDPALFEPCDPTVRSGCELTGTLSSVGLDDVIEPVSDVEIRAVDPASGRTISSTSPVVDGRFAIRVAPFDGDYDLQVVPGPGGSIYRATAFPGAMVGAPPELLIRRYPAVNYLAVVLDAETQAPVPLATVSFQSETAPDPISGAPATYRTSALSGEGDEAGRIAVALQPGVFTVVITPVETQNLAIHVEEVIIPDAEGVSEVIGQAFELDRRAELELELETFDGDPLDRVDVQVAPVPFGASSLPKSAAFARASSATTELDGAALLSIDLGIFEVFARPDASRGFPHAFASEVEIGSTAELREEELVVPPPTVLAGSVHTADGAPLGGATIRATLEVEGEVGTRFLRMGETKSESDGSYRLLLPSRL